jgi:hypothetical protein
MNLRPLVERVKQLMMAPRETLPLTLADPGSARQVLIPYVVLLAAIGPVAGFLSAGVLGVHVPGRIVFNTTVPAMYVRAPGPAMLAAIVRFLVGVLAWWCLARAFDLLAPLFSGRHDRSGAFKAAAATLTPIWLAGAFSLLNSVPHAEFLAYVAAIFSLAYAVLIAMYAAPLHLSTPEPKAVNHAIAALGVTVAASVASYVLVTWFVVRALIG